MATVQDAITYARQKAKTDSNGISDTNGLAWANTGLLDGTRELILRGVDAAQVVESYTTIAATDDPPGRFAWPTDMWMLKTIEMDYTGGGGSAYIQGKKVDISNLQAGTSWDYLRSNQPTSQPLFTNHGDTGEAFPTPTSSALVRIFYFLEPTEYSTVASIIAYPQSLDYRYIGDKILEGYYQSLGQIDNANAWGQIAMKKLTDSINILVPQSKQPTQSESLHINGWQF